MSTGNTFHNTISKEQTGRAAAQARSHVERYARHLLLTSNTSDEKITEITAQAARDVLFTALEQAPVTITGSAPVDQSLRQAATIATLQVREVIYPVALCNIAALKLADMTAPGEWTRRNALVLQATGRAVRDVYRAVLTACTETLGQDESGKSARRQALDLASHVSTIIDVTTNIEAIREHMPPFPSPGEEEQRPLAGPADTT